MRKLYAEKCLLNMFYLKTIVEARWKFVAKGATEVDADDDEGLRGRPTLRENSQKLIIIIEIQYRHTTTMKEYQGGEKR